MKFQPSKLKSTPNMPQRSDSLQVAVTNLSGLVRTHSEPVAMAVLDWVIKFVSVNVWDNPEHLLRMLIFYLLNMGMEMWLMSRANKMSLVRLWKKFVETIARAVGAILMLGVATGAAAMTSWFFWFPSFMMALLMAFLIVLLAKNASELGWLPPQIYQTLEKKITTQIDNSILTDEKITNQLTATELPEVLDTDPE